ncbi:MAG: glycoside hydrolase family 31 protein [Chloroflexota bacterium]|nr:glycoside hydrolase family 31 protein [Chloroflexota bacterium]
MRLTNPAPFTLDTPMRPDLLSLHGAHGETLRISALDAGIVRVEHLPQGAYRLDRTWSIVAGERDTPLEGQPRATIPTTSAAIVGAADGSLRFATDLVRAEIDLTSGALTWFSADHADPFAADLPSRPYVYDRAGRAVYHYMKHDSTAHYFGFGEVTGTLDKRGERIRLLNVDAAGYDARNGAPLYKHIPFYITYLSDHDIAYGLFYDNLATTTFDMGREVNGSLGGAYRSYHAEDGDLDYYLIYGPTIEKVVERYTWLTGRPALLPDSALGYLGSTMSYTEAPDAQAQLARFAALCREHDIPCDLFHLSSGYTTSADGRRYVFEWNRDRVPDPAAMVAHFHDAGIQVAPNVKPHLLLSHPRYNEVAARGGFISDPDTGAPALNRFWSGGMYQGENGSLLDFTNADSFAWWKDQITAHLLSYGMDAIWNDNNEFELWDDDALCDGFGAPFRVGLGGRGLGTLLMGRASYEALAAHAPDRPPFVLTRAGVPGIQRYAQTWSGDNTTSWETLKWNLPMGLGLGLSGVPNNGHDIGGFFGAAPDPELFVRWCQVGVFFPRFTIHSWNSDGTVNEPWMYPEVLPLIRDAIRLRYRLKPLLSALIHEAHETGHPIMRPLVYHYADDARARLESFDFMLGADLLIAPITEPDARERAVYLPTGAHGTQWVDVHSGTVYSGGATISAPAPLDRIPVFVRASATHLLSQFRKD